jgi:hypothetical protein
MELNRENLRRAINQLPEYQPPMGLWDDITEQLNLDQALKIPLREMPLYTPPDTVWEKLAEQIEQAPELTPKAQARPRFKWLLGALMLMFALGWWMFRPVYRPAEMPEQWKPFEPIAQRIQQNKTTLAQTNNTPKKSATVKPKPQMAHHTEVVDDALMMACQRADDPNYQLLETLCKEALPVCEEPQFKHLKAEFDDLSQAHIELKNAIGQFADDPDLVSKLIEIEHARGKILRQLIAMI